MKIKSQVDLNEMIGQMHDSEFGENDFSYDAQNKIFFLKSVNVDTEYILKLYNVEKYYPINLEKVKARKATAGVFNTIKIKNNGLDLTLFSQDLIIHLKLSKLDGEFEKESKY